MTPATELANPYPGLATFEEQDSARFFGRDREIDEVLDRLSTRRLLAVIGVSGCGKSSLIRAGVIPVLKMGAAENLPTPFQICTITPGKAPLQAMATALGAEKGWPTKSFDLVERARDILKSGESLLLVVDQFEELFSFRADTIAKDGGNAAGLFVNILLNAVDQRDVPIYVVLTMRTDFLGECAQFRGLPEALNDCYYLVPRMTRLQQQEAIERPLQEQGTVMHPALVQRLLNDSAEDPDHLPVLQHALKRTWENWSERGVAEPVAIEDYDAIGGWKEALDLDAEKVLSRFPAEQENIRKVFQWITERGTGDKPIRRPRPFSECLEISGLEREKLDEILRAFQWRGLLKPSTLVDVTHESVLWQWSRLKAWIADEAERASQIRFIQQSANRQLRLSGIALDSGLKLRSSWRTQEQLAQRYVTSQERKDIEDWIDQSESLERSKRRRRRFTVGGIALAVLLLAIVAILSFRAQRNSAEARELSAWVAVSLTEDPERSLILGLHSWGKQRAMVGGLEQFLHDALTQSAVRLTLRGHQDAVTSIAWSPDGSKLATASWDKTVKVWEASTGAELLTLHGHDTTVDSIAWSPDGSKLATASYDKTTKVWEAGTGRELLTLRGHQGAVMGISWSPDGSKLATASEDKTAKVWEADTGRELLTLRGHFDPVFSVAWSPDGSKLATASWNKTAKVWEADTGRELLAPRGHQGAVRSIAWSPDGSKLARASWDKTVKVWEAGNGHELLTLVGHQDRVRSVAWSPDGSKLATGSMDKTAKVWEAGTGRELLTLLGHQAAVGSVGWSPNGSRLATGSLDKTAKVWEAGNGHELLTLVGHQEQVRSVAWSPDGSKLATGSSDETAKVWEAGTGRELLTLSGHHGAVVSIAWSPDGSKLATASDDKTAKVWAASTGRELLTLRGHQLPVLSLAWSPDGSRLATGSLDGTAKVWEAGTGRELLTLSGHHGAVVSIAWSPDGSKLATASYDKTAKVWAASTGRELLTLRGHQLPVLSLAWSPDGSKLATASEDKTVQIYAIAPVQLLRLVRSRITRDLTPDECRRYLNTDHCPPLPLIP